VLALVEQFAQGFGFAHGSSLGVGGGASVGCGPSPFKTRRRLGT